MLTLGSETSADTKPLLAGPVETACGQRERISGGAGCVYEDLRHLM
jgi:hypothetical protein